MIDSDRNIDLLEKEYFHLQGVIERFDTKSLTIKAWSVSLAGAIAGASAFTDNKEVLLFASLVSLMFWFVDGYWKTFQYANYERTYEIEKFLRGDLKTLTSLQISDSWHKSFKRGGTKRLIKLLTMPHVILPHGAMFVLLLVTYLGYAFAD